MKIEYDLNKSNKNETKRDLPFDLVVGEWEMAILTEDTRNPIQNDAFLPLDF